MIPEKELIEIRSVSNGWTVKLFTHIEDDDSWKLESQYVYQEPEILLDILKKHIMSTKSMDAVCYE